MPTHVIRITTQATTIETTITKWTTKAIRTTKAMQATRFISLDTVCQFFQHTPEISNSRQPSMR